MTLPLVIPAVDDYEDWKSYARAIQAFLELLSVGEQATAQTFYYYVTNIEPGSLPAWPAGYTPLWMSNATAELYLANPEFDPPTAPDLVFIDTQAIADAAIETNKVANLAISTGKIIDLAVSTLKIAALAVDNAKLATDAVSQSKVADNAIGTAEIINLNVTTGKIANLAVDSAQIADLAVVNAKIGLLAVLTANIQDAAIVSAKIADANIITAKINDAAVVTAKIADANVVTAKIGDLQVTTGKINDLAVNDAKIANLAVTSAKIANLAVGTAHIQLAAITSALILDGSVVNAKIGQTIQSSSWNPTTKAGWMIDKAGNISGQSLAIYDTAGNLVFGSGGTLDFSRLVGTDGSLNAIGSFSTVNGRGTVKSGGTSAHQGGAVGQGSHGAQFVRSNILGASAGGAYLTTITLSSDATTAAHNAAQTYGAQAQTTAAGVATIFLNSGTTVVASKAGVAVSDFSRMWLKYDETRVYIEVDGVEIEGLSVPAPPSLKLWPKVLDYYNYNGSPAYKYQDVDFGPLTSNARKPLKLYAFGTAGAIEIDNNAFRKNTLGVAGGYDAGVYGEKQAQSAYIKGNNYRAGLSGGYYTMLVLDDGTREWFLEIYSASTTQVWWALKTSTHGYITSSNVYTAGAGSTSLLAYDGKLFKLFINGELVYTYTGTAGHPTPPVGADMIPRSYGYYPNAADVAGGGWYSGLEYGNWNDHYLGNLGGATIISLVAGGGTNLLGQMSAANISTYIASAAIGTALIADLAVTNAKIADATIQSAKIVSLDANKINAASLSAITATIGLLRTATTGSRLEVESNQIRVYDASNVLRVRMGIW